MVLPKSSTMTLKRTTRKKARAAYPSSHYAKAMYFKQKGDKSHALVEFLKATQENPRLTRAFYEQALIFRERGYLKLAQSSLEQALALKPDYHEGRMLLATIQIQQGNVGGAMQQLGQSLGIAVATKDDGKNDGDEFPQPTVLQSLHMLLPEKVATGIAKLTVGATGGASKSNSKSASKTEQKIATRNKNKKAPIAKVEPVQDAIQIMEPKNSESTESLLAHLPNPLHMLFPNAKSDNSEPAQNAYLTEVTSAKDKDSVSSKDKVSNAAIGKESTSGNAKAGAKSESKSADSSTGDEAVSLDPANLPSLPPAEEKSDASEPTKNEKPHKHSKKNWLSRMMTALDTTQETTNEAPPAPPPIVADDEPKPGDADVRSIPPLKPEPAAVPPTQVETFEKPDQPRQIIEKVTAMANAAISNVAKGNFQIPNLPNLNTTLFNAHPTATEGRIEGSLVPPSAEEPKPYKPVIAPNSDDPWSVRLRYLADHGTGTLKEGEAFMFSEETGEATLFLSDGQTVRRTIYLPRDAQEVVKQRRPDILTPDDLLYNLSLLAKLMPKPNEQEQPANAAQTEQTTTTQPQFEVNDLMGKSQRFWGWMKGALKL